MKNRMLLLVALLALLHLPAVASTPRQRYNFNAEWQLAVGDNPAAKEVHFDDGDWKRVTLPRPFNEDEAFRLDIHHLTDTVIWYRKHFRLPQRSKNKRVFVEFEGVRQGADFYINGHHIGLHENGAMAVGFDLTPYIRYKGENVMALRIDNDWQYRERATETRFQWNDRNFNANYGGIPKNVWLHLTEPLYQTLPLYSNLQTTGVYVYADKMQIKERQAEIHVESEVQNAYKRPKQVTLRVELFDREGRLVKQFEGETAQLKAGEKRTLKASAEVTGLHFWSWGYGYLYMVKSSLWVDGKLLDEVKTRTGFRKTRFAEGKVWLNDRVIQLKGYAQRTSNEWPGVGMSVPAWLSDYSNGLMVEGNANLVRWMHITPWKQDVESCDRVGLMQAMPAGDAEKDREGRQWEQRKELMRDAIIYNRNNPSILFYECGNESISREHMVEMKALRDQYDPHGGRAIGSREMLDIREAEYGGEMLYINKSKHHPMWAMEYCRDEALRKYWDEYSYPYHIGNERNRVSHWGMLHKGEVVKDMSAYNRNQDSFTLEHIARWYDYWRERPGTGERVSSGGVKIIFSDTNTHYRGEENYRRSGVTDPMRIAKDSYFAHQVMWDGWVDIEQPRIHIVGHWNYKPEVVKPLYVVSSAEEVELLLNGRSLGRGEKSYQFLFTFPDVRFEKGQLEAVGYDKEGNVCCRTTLQTAGAPSRIALRAIENPLGWMADGADLALIEVEVTDDKGQRCPLANNLIHFEIEGAAEWRGGIAQGEANYTLSKDLPVECGINRALVRSLTTAGTVRITARAEGLQEATLTLTTEPIEVQGGLSSYLPGEELASRLTRGETPLTPSYTERKQDVGIRSATAGIHAEEAHKSYDDNELSEWKNDGRPQTAWISYELEREACIDEICLKLTGWRMRSYPLEIFADGELIWSGDTEKSLGYIHLSVKPVTARRITIRLKGANEESDQFGQIVEVAAPAAGELDLFKAKNGDKTNHELRIVEVEFKETL